MELSLTEEQQMLATTVAEFTAKESPVERARKMRTDEIGWSKDLWKKMGELGWLSVPFSENDGGFGGSFVDAAVVIEELGKTLVPEPYVPSVILAGTALGHAGSQEQKEKALTPLIAGDISLALATSEPENRYDIAIAQTTATGDGKNVRLNGKKIWVENGHAADYLVVSATDSRGLGLYLVTGNADGVARDKVETIDGRGAAHVEFKNAAAEQLGQPGESTEVLLNLIFDLGAAAACAESLGIAQTAFDMTLDYLKTREQFEAKIGAFQALQHRTVDMYIENQLLKAATMASTIRVTEDDLSERIRAVSSAKKQLALGGNFVTRQSIQLHGGIGATDEHDIGLYFKRMHVLSVLFGDDAWHEQRYAANL